jgi:hypothetical protein
VAGKRRRRKTRGNDSAALADSGKIRRKKSRKGLITAIIVVVLLAAGAAAAYFCYFDGKALAGWLGLRGTGGIAAPKKVLTCPLDGTVADAALIARRPLIVKVENHTDARPQSGLNKADIVIEAMAEGGITRFAAIFLCHSVDEIGPVRSGRLQDIIFISEYDALFAHVGGSDAFDDAKFDDMADLDEFSYSDSYWRSKDRDAPHNVYTTTERLHNAARDEGYEKQVALDSWAFKKGNPGAGTVTKVDIPYGADCAVSYTYDAASNSYLRFVEGEPFTDKPTGVQIAPKNVVVMYVSYESSDDGEEYGLGGRDEMQLIGEGRAVIFRDGEAVDGLSLRNPDALCSWTPQAAP